MRLHQVRVGPMHNFAYLLADESGEGALVDPGFEVPRLVAAAKEAGIRVGRVLVTHGHPDHAQGVPEAKRLTGAPVVAHAGSDVPHDHGAVDGERLSVGDLAVEVLHTPGHRFDSVCYVVDGTHLLTGDTLFVGECGRVDLPGSDPVAMHRTLLTKLAALPEHLVVLPGHDYGPTPTSTLAHERRTNYTLKPRTLDEFLRFMAEP